MGREKEGRACCHGGKQNTGQGLKVTVTTALQPQPRAGGEEQEQQQEQNLTRRR